ncbi:uncharacterized protein LY89DRAFT_718145 [Mollisia scopiformis]|uniref:BRCT domain-containing protein n=1 Tax=Mollisia scopiformis TaxID=149040 RepID=A0A194XBA1_MOLSC|nr:uncharacterized protein LY89DRAFT_718145 [Mollisia scopiformis]KUJ17446.1 hypothetical protein LY89DRAFT_718145 [Mollisia scopiformis]
MPYASIKAAEQAALRGIVPDTDTQLCEGIQQDLLSSPANTPHHVASANLDANNFEPVPEVELEDEHEEDEDEEECEDELQFDANHAKDHQIPGEAAQLISDFNSQREDANRLSVDDAGPESHDQVAQIQIRRDSKGKLRAFTISGEEVKTASFEGKYRAAVEAQTQEAAMEDLTQKSSMSLTQENPESAYQHFDLQQAIHEEFPSTATPDDGKTHGSIPNLPQDSIPSKQHASTRTESTAYTYQEQDTGHVKLDFEPGVDEDEMDNAMEDGMDDDMDSQSQDAYFAAPQLGMHFAAPSYDPQTPVAPVNPFSEKGSLLKGFEMFSATQPSSVARHASPTSSRPSPDVYHDFTSPPKRQRTNSSPLTRLYEQDVETSPLQSSVRGLLMNTLSSDFPESTVPRTSGVQSFDMVRSNSLPEPRPYVSMKESQEKRKREDLGSNSDSDGSDSDGTFTRKRKRERESRIQRELSTVAIPPRRAPATVRPQSSASPAIEVPSTGRRRSIQEKYLAQCEGQDAQDTEQDTQPDDYIADSQGGPDQNASAQVHDNAKGHNVDLDMGQSLAVSDTPSRSPRRVGDAPGHPQSQNPASLPENGLHVDQQSQPQNPELANDAERSSPGPSLPLKESTGNRSNTRTPIAQKSNLLSDGMIPETSPPEERIRPMGEIASISFREIQIDMSDLPGFSQDPEFENVLRLGSPQSPIPRPRSFRQGMPSQEPLNVTVAPAQVPGQLPEVPTSSANVPSTLLNQGQPEVTKSSSPLTPVVSNEGMVEEEDAPSQNDNPVPENPIPELPQENISEKGDMNNENQNEQSQDQGDIEEDPPGKHDAAHELTADATESKSSTIDDGNQGDADIVQAAAEPSSPKQTGPRRKADLKAPARSLRSSEAKATTSKASARVTKTKSAKELDRSSASSTPTLTPAERSSTRSQAARAKASKQSTPAATGKRTLRRQPGVTLVEDDDTPMMSTRNAKRHVTAKLPREDSEDPLTSTPASTHKNGRSKKSGTTLFDKMAFAVSYVKNSEEKDTVTKYIVDNGARLLQDGFDALFDVIPKTASEDAQLCLSGPAESLGFTACIADEHSRKAKFIQALALGLPCISGRWVMACVAKMAIVDWAPYLLCAGQSSFLGNAVRSRILRPYSASDAELADVFAARDKFLEGKSVLFVTGKGKTEDKRKAYVFLTRALGPAQVAQVVDYQEARKHLTESEAQNQFYDLLFVEKDESVADSVVFGAAAMMSKAGKRKRSVEPVELGMPPPKKIRVIGDETVVQSLILGQLLEE